MYCRASTLNIEPSPCLGHCSKCRDMTRCLCLWEASYKVSNRGQNGGHSKSGKEAGAGEALGLQEGARTAQLRAHRSWGGGGQLKKVCTAILPPNPPIFELSMLSGQGNSLGVGGRAGPQFLPPPAHSHVSAIELGLISRSQGTAIHKFSNWSH